MEKNLYFILLFLISCTTATPSNLLVFSIQNISITNPTVESEKICLMINDDKPCLSGMPFLPFFKNFTIGYDETSRKFFFSITKLQQKNSDLKVKINWDETKQGWFFINAAKKFPQFFNKESKIIGYAFKGDITALFIITDLFINMKLELIDNLQEDFFTWFQNLLIPGSMKKHPLYIPVMSLSIAQVQNFFNSFSVFGQYLNHMVRLPLTILVVPHDSLEPYKMLSKGYQNEQKIIQIMEQKEHDEIYRKDIQKTVTVKTTNPENFESLVPDEVNKLLSIPEDSVAEQEKK
jgi:hypothetical protein